MTGSFYDRIVRKFGVVGTQAEHITEYPEGDPEKDKSFLEAYVAASQTHKGIHLPRHRFVTAAVKS